MNGLRDEFLAGARFAADQDGRVRARDLRHLLADAVHRAARAEDLREIVALAQLALQPDVLLHEALAVRLDEPLHLDRLRDHGCDDAEELCAALVVAVRFVGQLERQHARRTPVQQQRHAYERPLVSVRVSIGQRRLAAHTRHHDGTAAGEDLERQPAAGDARMPRPVASGADRGRDLELRAIVRRQRDRAPDRVVRFLEDLEHAVQRGLEVNRARQRLADFDERRELPDLAALPRRPDIHAADAEAVVDVGGTGDS